MELIDGFCGEGGAARGYADIGFNVYGVDNNRARLSRYPYPHERRNMLDALADTEFMNQFDVAHMSPPCTGYTRGTAAIPDRLQRYDRLIPIVRELLDSWAMPYVIENVEDARSEMQEPVRLCWTAFYEPGSVLDTDGTPLQMHRHRLFESNMPLYGTECRHDKDMQVAGSYGGARRDAWEARNVRRGGYVPKSVDVQRQLLGTDWMSEKGCYLSIPPVYTQFIGKQILAVRGD